MLDFGQDDILHFPPESHGHQLCSQLRTISRSFANCETRFYVPEATTGGWSIRLSRNVLSVGCAMARTYSRHFQSLRSRVYAMGEELRYGTENGPQTQSP